VAIQLKAGKWKWIGHPLRKDSFAAEEWVFSWSPQGKRRRGGPRRNWRGMIKKKSWSIRKNVERDQGNSWKNSALACLMGAGGGAGRVHRSGVTGNWFNLILVDQIM